MYQSNNLLLKLFLNQSYYELYANLKISQMHYKERMLSNINTLFKKYS